MRIKAIILDLDNTIYPVPAIGNTLFRDLFALIERNGAYRGDLEAIKAEIMRRPFQLVAREHHFSEELTKECLQLLTDLTYDQPIATFPGYEYIRKLPVKKYLVTTGFTKQQHSKIRQLGIEGDFDEIVVVDPARSALTKKDIFQRLLREHGYQPSEVLVMGDDPESEIRAARELGINTVLYIHQGERAEAQNVINDYRDLERYLY